MNGIGIVIAKEIEIEVGQTGETSATLVASANLEMGVTTAERTVASIIVTRGGEETDDRTSALSVDENVPRSRRSNLKS